MAKKHTLRIRLSSVDGAVIRALGLMERRGYSLSKCTISEADDSGRDMEVTVSSSRSGDLLRRQLQRLHDVLDVELVPTVIVNPAKPGITTISRSTT